MILKKKIGIIYITFLLFFSFFINQHYGYIGINPIDSFFSYNTGYDILNGYYPFKDYWTITGPFIGLAQAILFKIFGVSWSSYVMQASIFNSIITITTFYTLNKFKLNINYCFLYAFFVSILSYPSVGTPYVDHQSSYLSVVSIFCFILALKTNLKIYWLILPIIIAVAFLTKQAPAGHIFIIIIMLSTIYFIFNFNIKKILLGVFGSLIIISIFITTLMIGKISLISFFEQYILFPLSLGESRLDYLFPLEFKRVVMRFKLIHLSLLIPIIVVLKKLVYDYKYLKDNEFLIIISLVGLYLTLIAHQLMTINGLFIFFIIPILTGFSHIYYLKYFKNKKYIIFVLLLLSFGSTIHYTSKYIHKRDFADLRKININKAIDAKELDVSLSGLKWITPLYPDDPEKEIIELQKAINIIKEDTRKKSIVTDYQFISVILSSYDYSPSQAWFSYHINPEKNSKYFKIYNDFFLDRLKENKIQIVYIVKPLWGGEDVFEKSLNSNCYIKEEITEILDSYLLTKCYKLMNQT